MMVSRQRGTHREVSEPGDQVRRREKHHRHNGRRRPRRLPDPRQHRRDHDSRRDARHAPDAARVGVRRLGAQHHQDGQRDPMAVRHRHRIAPRPHPTRWPTTAGRRAAAPATSRSGGHASRRPPRAPSRSGRGGGIHRTARRRPRVAAAKAVARWRLAARSPLPPRHRPGPVRIRRPVARCGCGSRSRRGNQRRGTATAKRSRRRRAGQPVSR